jgi:hypothetical protein
MKARDVLLKFGNALNDGFCTPIAAMSLPAHIALLKRHCGEGRKNEKIFKNDDDPIVKAPKKITTSLYFFYWLKILFMLVSYALIAIYLFKFYLNSK